MVGIEQPGLAAAAAQRVIEVRQAGGKGRRHVWRGRPVAERRIDLTPQEYKLLEYLARRKGETVTRTMLLESLWGFHFDPRTNRVDAHVSRLRSKVDRGFSAELIRTLRGVGYVIDEPE